MAFKMNLKSSIVPVSINEMDFQVDTTDEKMALFNEKYVALIKHANGIQLEDEANYRELLEEAMDVLLGTGSFARLYEGCPNSVVLFTALNQLVENLMKSLLFPSEVEFLLEADGDKKKKKRHKRFGGRN